MCSSKHTTKIVTFSDICNTFPDYPQNLTFPINIVNTPSKPVTADDFNETVYWADTSTIEDCNLRIGNTSTTPAVLPANRFH